MKQQQQKTSVYCTREIYRAISQEAIHASRWKSWSVPTTKTESKTSFTTTTTITTTTIRESVLNNGSGHHDPTTAATKTRVADVGDCYIPHEQELSEAIRAKCLIASVGVDADGMNINDDNVAVEEDEEEEVAYCECRIFSSPFLTYRALRQCAKLRSLIIVESMRLLQMILQVAALVHTTIQISSYHIKSDYDKSLL